MRRSASRRARARGRSVHHHAGGTRRRGRTRAGGGRGGPHRHRRLPLVHRLGPRHDDQPRGADAVDAPLPRGRRTSCARSATTCARTDPQHVSGRRARRAVSHRRRDAVVLPRASSNTSASPATRETLRTLLPDVRRHRPASHRRHAVRHRRRSGTTVCCARGQRATSSRGWTRRSTTGWSRRGGARRSRSTRSGTTRCGCCERWIARSWTTPATSWISTSHAERARESFNRRFWYAGGGPSLRRRRRRARRRSGVPAEPGARDFAGSSGARPRAMEAGDERGSRAAC